MFKKLIGLVVLVGAGYWFVHASQKERDDVIATGKAYGNQAAQVVGKAWKSTSDEVSKLTPESAMAALTHAEDQLKDATAKLEPGKRLDDAKAQFERIRAAIDIQKLHKEMDEKVDDARKMKDNADKTVEDVRAKLDAANKSYQDLHAKLDQAQKTYDDAAQKVADIQKSIREKVGD